MRRRVPLKNVWLLLLCAPLIGIPIYGGIRLAERFVEPLSLALFNVGLTSGYVSDVQFDHESDTILTGVAAVLMAGLVATIPAVLLGALMQPPPKRIRRAIACAPKSLAFGFPLLLMINMLGWCLTFVPLGIGNGQVDLLWVIASMIIAPVLCIWAHAWRRRTCAAWKTRARRRMHLCPSCSYDLRGCAGDRCPECGATRRAVCVDRAATPGGAGG